ncbi:hypothetical protein [Yoonia sp.]|jgi:hypothetical protein|uniref:hypothetical protein n=1 Tax=Yoonia sp. TaxID=2212373 RepID=UPI0023A6C5B9|nr:hypothetical protein [Yoonia sp.]MDE0851097.1 hypothetical protein [Yoonia sp.]
MAVTTDIVRTWRSPRVVMRELLGHGQREDRAIAYVMAACLILYVAQWPRLKRAEQFELYGPDGASDFQMNAGIAFFSMLIVWPLGLYAIAAVSHLVAKIFRSKGTHYAARLALFWSLLTTTPVLLLHGLTVGLIGPGSAANLVGGVWVISFIAIWSQCLRVAEGETHAL